MDNDDLGMNNPPFQRYIPPCYEKSQKYIPSCYLKGNDGTPDKDGEKPNYTRELLKMKQKIMGRV